MLPQTLQYRSDNQALTATLARRWAAIWPALDLNNLDGTFPAWLGAAAALEGAARKEAATAAQAYLGTFTGFPPVSPPPLPPAQFLAAMQVTTVASVKAAMTMGVSLPDASAVALDSSLGSASRLALNAGRGVVMGTAVADPKCEGWQRVGAGECNFCQMLIGRGAVYTESSSRFRSHDRCHCSAEPVYR